MTEKKGPKKIIYHCFGGAHSSLVAANIHVGRLSFDRPPTWEELMALPGYEQRTAKDHGHIFYVGNDEYGNEVYVLGRRNYSSVARRAIYGIARVIGLKAGEVVMIDAMPCVNWLMVIGGYLSRRCGLVRIGRPIVVAGTRRAFYYLCALALSVKERYALPNKETYP